MDQAGGVRSPAGVPDRRRRWSRCDPSVLLCPRLHLQPRRLQPVRRERPSVASRVDLLAAAVGRHASVDGDDVRRADAASNLPARRGLGGAVASTDGLSRGDGALSVGAAVPLPRCHLRRRRPSAMQASRRGREGCLRRRGGGLQAGTPRVSRSGLGSRLRDALMQVAPDRAREGKRMPGVHPGARGRSEGPARRSGPQPRAMSTRAAISSRSAIGPSGLNVALPAPPLGLRHRPRPMLLASGRATCGRGKSNCFRRYGGSSAATLPVWRRRR